VKFRIEKTYSCDLNICPLSVNSVLKIFSVIINNEISRIFNHDEIICKFVLVSG